MSKKNSRLFQPKQEEQDEEDISSSLLELRELNVLLFVRKSVLSYIDKKEASDRAKEISEVDQNNFIVDIKSDLSFMMRALSTSKMDLDTLSNKMVRIGWKKRSTQSESKVVESLLSDYFYIFKRNKNNLFSIRKGFSGPETETITNQIQQPVFVKAATLSDIVNKIINEYMPKDGITCVALSNLLDKFGVDASYRLVYSILQNNKSLIVKNNKFHLKE